MSTAYWVSCPQFTCLVIANAAGIVTDTAPYLWRWRGQALLREVGRLQRRYGWRKCRVVRLEDGGAGAERSRAT